MKYKIGVDLGGTHIGVGLVNKQGKLVDKYYAPTPQGRDFEETVCAIKDAVNALLTKNNIKKDNCESIGIGSPGIFDKRSGEIVYSTNFGWKNKPLGERLNGFFKLPVYVGNDADVAGWAEFLYGAGKGSKNCVTVTLGTGVGGGLVINGHLFSGGMPGGGELGHMTLVVEGHTCACGKKGCAEAYCSATALIRMAEEEIAKGKSTVLKMGLEGKDVIEGAKNRDSLSMEIFDNYVNYLAHLLSGIINLLAPEVIAIGGGVSQAGDFLLSPLKKRVAQLVLNKSLPHAEIVCAQMGNDAGIIGAALLEE